MDEREINRRAAQARVARIGTVDEQGRVHIVPIVFALDGEVVYSASDAGPRPAKRLRNLEHDNRVTLLIDVYDEEWTKVWWVRLRGAGRIVEHQKERQRAVQLLVEKYPQFGDGLDGPIMAVDIENRSGWAYSD
jgi:PPOX class probable F420-dependent enzyme